MLTAFPPTLIDTEVLNVQGTAYSRYMYTCRLISGTRERTSVDALPNLGCRPSTIDRPEQCCNAGGIAENLFRPCVKDRCFVSYNRISVHRNATERCQPVTLFNGRHISTCNKSIFLDHQT
jgi:hypothetical protein